MRNRELKLAATVVVPTGDVVIAFDPRGKRSKYMQDAHYQMSVYKRDADREESFWTNKKTGRACSSALGIGAKDSLSSILNFARIWSTKMKNRQTKRSECDHE